MFIAGIDGGGTHTRIELRDSENRFVCRREYGPFNLNSIGEDAFRCLLRQVFTDCVDMAQCASICFGAAGISNPLVSRILSEELDASGFRGIWKLCGDQEIALRGAMDTPGVAVIAGTGSICFGKNAAGETARSGGYGHLIDDGGSGYALGRDVLSAAVRQYDGRLEGDAIQTAVFARLGCQEPGAIVSFVYSPSTDKSMIAKFSGIALELAQQGDPRALDILERGAEELSFLVRAVQEKLSLEGCPIALLGGLIQEDNVYRRTVAQRLESLGTVIAPGHDALWGAAQIAWEHYKEKE
ncbi:MAG: hypothetical protein IKC09_07025 [Oscillospiraceae bacterium]|nr:hypothetical protein [Oscillospiraceae bacterium]MBR2890008.1 hypothetical protein [Oscillospiraceae bacterium]